MEEAKADRDEDDDDRFPFTVSLPERDRSLESQRSIQASSSLLAERWASESNRKIANKQEYKKDEARKRCVRRETSLSASLSRCIC